MVLMPLAAHPFDVYAWYMYCAGIWSMGLMLMEFCAREKVPEVQLWIIEEDILERIWRRLQLME